jgi:hypothetical protein
MALFALKNESLIRLDEQVFQYNVRFANFYQRRLRGMLVNFAVLDQLIDEGDALRAKVGGLDSSKLDGFEALVQRHLKANLEAQNDFLQYWFLGGIARVEDLVERTFGSRALSVMKAAFLGYDFEADARLIDIESRIKPALIQGHRAVAKTLNAIVPFLAEQLVGAGMGDGLVPQAVMSSIDPETIAVVLKTGSQEHGAAWYERSRTVELSEREFHVFRSGSRLLINAGLPAMTLAHEILGHAVQGACSAWLPLTVSGADENLTNITSMPVVEGFALEREHYGEGFVRSRADSLAFEVGPEEILCCPLASEELQLAVLLNHSEERERAVRCYTGFLCLKQMDDPSFDPHVALAEQWGGHLSRSKHKIVAKSPLDVIPRSTEVVDFLYDLSYLLGPVLVRDTLARIGGELGWDFVQTHHSLISQVLATGAWAHSVYADWAIFALEHREEFEEESASHLAIRR